MFYFLLGSSGELKYNYSKSTETNCILNWLDQQDTSPFVMYIHTLLVFSRTSCRPCSCCSASYPPSWRPPFISLHYCFSLSPQELKLPAYRGHSPQIGMRRYFADLLAILSNRYQLCPTARHLAVYLLDLFMDHYDVAVKQLYVIALTCLLLASKCIFILHPSICFFLFCFASLNCFLFVESNKKVNVLTIVI